ncbi:NAD-dependent epimerase/dehydratase family protein [Flavobacterium sp. TAB 87]|uniref:NAD-dependent epimerase/dehydratase family protein n=1 Tax=Flavobacterium sp. TAB 87 TaxID=1729581 RepID=UPI00076BC18E|nr:NAD-dependent epimerase/dehydratase family protein [Flavobacterium sp. TAB 87]KVV13181.1 Cholesterol dehydrogenase [Flavobacterium sp. TAB 87]
MILITGATGLVGAHLALHLIEKGNTVRAIYRDAQSIDKTKAYFDFYQKGDLIDKLEWIQGDILDVPSLETVFVGIDFVYHCAAFISFDPNDEEKIRKTNIEGTANIVNFCIAKNIQKLCFLSSIAALGDIAPHEESISETTDWNPEKPHSDYAISKYGAEMEVWRGHQEGLDVLVLNPGVIMGPYIKTTKMQQGSATLYHRVANGLSFYTLGRTGFITINDVVTIAIELMESDVKNEGFSLVAENIVFREILDAIARSLGVKKPRIHADASLMNILWRIDWLLSKITNKKPQISKAGAKASYSKNLYSNAKIKRTLDYKFENVIAYISEKAIR